MGGAPTPDVYVQIPAYRDGELSATLRDLYARAVRPDRLRVRVLWQRGPSDAWDPSLAGLPHLEVEEWDHQDSEGCNWARRRLQAQWRDEPYTVLLDSHHRFVDGWDELGIGMYEALRRSGVERPLLTAYLPPYDPADDPAGRDHRPFAIYPLEREGGILTRLTSYSIPRWQDRHAPVPADFLSLHFVLTEGAFNRTVPLDAGVYFFGDEVLTGLRAFTHGYDLYHPHRVLGWHAYDRARRVTHWADHAGWREVHDRSLERLRSLFLDRAASDPAFGTRRTVADYERHIVDDLVLR
ncbi:GlcNAc-transferase family protein [Actinomycetospora sp. OC33-EN08]|uniref:GlcNAc-transferase family protein n=1 Tax=Actinomycetospora aurantiaca TaxID=3129233 RepID=A0ABU8MQR3_9PSEU